MTLKVNVQAVSRAEGTAGLGAVLAAGALVASILAVGASPAAGQAMQQPDARSTWLACVGAAKGGGGFTDVDMGSPHYDNINCLAYYGITTGKTADTYDARRPPQTAGASSRLCSGLRELLWVVSINQTKH